jgi:methionyl-tRNA formyltransferase
MQVHSNDGAGHTTCQNKIIRKIAFAGTPVFAAEILAFLHQQNQFDIKMVLSMPDQPKGRGLELTPTPVKAYALEHGLNIFQPPSLSISKNPDAQDIHTFLKEEVDCLVVVAYGMLLPKVLVESVLCLNIHASLLPRWRGAAPIQRAIEAGDNETGIAIMHMNAGLDTGDVLYQKSIPILEKNTLELTQDLQQLSQTSILHTLLNYQDLAKKALVQPTEGVTYAHKIEKSEALISFNQKTSLILQKIRAFNPFPAVCFQLKGVLYKIWQANQISLPNQPITYQTKLDDVSGGTAIYFFEDAVIIQTLDGYLNIQNIQAPNKKAMPITDFLRGFTII